MKSSALPGQITFPLEAVYATYPDAARKIHCQFDEWRTSVPMGATATVDTILNAHRKLGDPGHGMPLEIVRDLLCAGDGWNSIDGVTVDTSAMPWLVKKVAHCPSCGNSGSIDIHHHSTDHVIGGYACPSLDDPDCHSPATPVPLAAFIVPGHHPDCDGTCNHAYPGGCPPF